MRDVLENLLQISKQASLYLLVLELDQEGAFAWPLREIKNYVTFAPVKTYRSLMEVRRLF